MGSTDSTASPLLTSPLSAELPAPSMGDDRALSGRTSPEDGAAAGGECPNPACTPFAAVLGVRGMRGGCERKELFVRCLCDIGVGCNRVFVTPPGWLAACQVCLALSGRRIRIPASAPSAATRGAARSMPSGGVDRPWAASEIVAVSRASLRTGEGGAGHSCPRFRGVHAWLGRAVRRCPRCRGVPAWLANAYSGHSCAWYHLPWPHLSLARAAWSSLSALRPVPSSPRGMAVPAPRTASDERRWEVERRHCTTRKGLRDALRDAASPPTEPGPPREKACPRELCRHRQDPRVVPVDSVVADLYACRREIIAGVLGRRAST